MGYRTVHAPKRGPRADLWALVRKQHGVVTKAQLLELGFSHRAIVHRLVRGRLHPVRRGVYAVGRPELTRKGLWMAAVLSCGLQAVLSHGSAAALWGIGREERGIEVSVPVQLNPRPHEIVVHRRRKLDSHQVTRCDGIPVTTPICTLLDLATYLKGGRLERAIGEGDRLNLVDTEALRSALDEFGGRPGTGVLRKTLDRRTFALTASNLERRFLQVVRAAGLSLPQTGQLVNGFAVDFYWPDLQLVIETDGLRYHRTPAQQARDRVRDQAHVAAGMTCLRFTHAQVAFESGKVRSTLTRVARRLSDGGGFDKK